VAYQADILINVKGFQDLGRIQKMLDGTAQKIDQVNRAAAVMGAPNRNLERFSRQLDQAQRALNRVAIGSVQEQRAVSNYVTALNNSNVARDRQNKLIQTELNTRNAVINAIRATVEANIAESQATRAARAEASALNKELIQQERLRRKLEERGLTQLASGQVVKASPTETALPKARGPASPIGGRADIPGSPAALKAASAAQGKLFENLALGAGFPLLFGGGPGQVLGGLLGSFVGTGFGGQILGSALGGQLQALGVAANQAGTALQKPIDNFNIIKDRALLASSSQDKYVERLIESGRFIEATAEIQRRYNEVIGREGSANLLELTKATDRLNRAWSELGLQIQAAIAGPLAGFVEWLAGFLQLTNNARRGAAAESQLTPDQRAEIAGRRQALERGRQRGTLFGGLTPQQALREEQAIARRAQELAASNQPRQINTDFRATETAQLASLERQAAIQAQLTKLTDTRLQLSSKQLQTDISVLNKQQELTTSLNQQTGIINTIAQKKTQSAQLELALTQSQQRLSVQNAQLELQRAEAKAAAAAAEMRQLDAAGKLTGERRAELQAVMEQAVVARQNLSTTEQIAYYTNQSAASQAATAQYMADIERRQAIVNAYAEDYARVTAETTRQIEEQANAFNNRATLLNAISQTTQTLNNIEIQALERELERVTTAKERENIINRIYKLEVENARVQLEATRANIQAELIRADTALNAVELKYEELKAVVAIAKAEGVINNAHFDALRAQESALRIAQENLNTAGKVANLQWKAADAVFKAAVDAAKLKKETTGAAQSAGQFAGSMERAAGAMGGISKAASALGAGGAGAPFGAMGGTGAIQDPGLKAQAEKIWKEAERFAATKGIASIQADILQRARDAIARIAFRDYVLQQKAAGAPAVSTETPATPITKTPSTAPIPLTAPLASGLSMQPGGGPGTAIIDTLPTINLQTGPVLQQENGEKYVRLGDLENILQDFAATVFNNARSTGGRRFQGVN